MAQDVAKPPLRLMFVYTPGGMIMDAWTPKSEGADYVLSPTLAPLEPFKADVLVLSGLDNRLPETGGNGHPIASSTWLSRRLPTRRRDAPTRRRVLVSRRRFTRMSFPTVAASAKARAGATATSSS